MTLDLEAIKRRRAAITPLPWALVPEVCGPDGQMLVQVTSMGCIVEVGDPYPRGDNRPQENMAFFLHAPTDIDALLAEVERLREAKAIIFDGNDRRMA